MKKHVIAVIVVLLTLLTVGLVSGCDAKDAEAYTRVSAVQIEDTHIYMAPSDEPGVFILKPWVIPSDAANKELNYKILNSEDKIYASVDAGGKIIADRAKEDGDVIVRISSKDNPKAYLDINVTIEIASVKKISFFPSVSNFTLGSEPSQIKPVFTPYHAILGRNVSYYSLNEEVATVDSLGFVTPVGVGKTTIRVTASNDENIPENLLVKGYLQVGVSHSPPNYTLSITDPALAYKQIIGAPSVITLALDKMDTTCDNNPYIRWRVAGAPIPRTDDYKTISYLPADLPRGEYTIEATITDSSSQVQVLHSDTIHVYEKLTGVDIMVYNAEEKLAVNDTISMEVSFSEDEYPPDNYRWTIYKNGQELEVKTYPQKTFDYKIKSEGSYSFKCEAIIQGNLSGVSRTTPEYYCDVAIIGNDIYNVYVTARKFNNEIVPYIAWDPMYYSASYTAKIQTADSRVYTLKSSDPNDKAYFSANGLYVPAHIADLSDSFSVTLRSGGYGWTETVNYNGDISLTNEDRGYFELIVSDFDGYIANMEELGRLLNYVNVFRPDSLKDGDWYKLNLKIPFRYADLSQDTYPLPETEPAGNPANQDVQNVVDAAFKSYCDSVTYWRGINYNTNTRALELSLKFEAEDPDMVDTSEHNGAYVNEKVVRHYASVPRGSGVLPIDSLTESMAVSTSMQLYYAVALGYRPDPAAGSIAEDIYNKARAVSRRIINNGMNDAQKVHAIYDFLTTEIIYDRWIARPGSQQQGKIYKSFHLEGVFIDGLAVCDGIAKAFILLCGIEGIASVKINGHTATEGHAWNKVLVEGDWYVVDATWGSYLSQGSNIELQTHRYLLTTDSYIQGTHNAYGKQQLTSTTPHNVYYNGEVAAGIDYTINSAQELAGLIGYMEGLLSTPTDTVWVDFALSSEYYNTIKNGVYSALSTAISGSTDLSFSLEASNTNKFVAVRLYNR